MPQHVVHAMAQTHAPTRHTHQIQSAALWYKQAFGCSAPKLPSCTAKFNLPKASHSMLRLRSLENHHHAMPL